MADQGNLYDDVDTGRSSFARRERMLMRKIIREMTLLTDPNELSVLLFIFDRTFCYGKLAEAIPLRHFMEGVSDRSDDLLIPPLKLSRSSLYRAIDGLIEKSIIFRKNGNVRQSPVYGICEDWSRSRDALVPPVGRISPAQGTIEHREYNKENNNSSFDARTRTREGSTESVNNMSMRDNVIAAIEAATTKGVTARQRKKTRGNATSYETIWRDAYVSHNEGERWFQWTNEQKAMFKRAMDRGAIPEAEREAFITFIVQNFPSILSDKFRGWKMLPENASSAAIPFITKQIVKFWEAFEDSRDPNRALNRRVAHAGVSTPTAPKTDNAELQELRKQNADLKEKLVTVVKEKRLKLRRPIKRVVKPRAEIEKGDGEFVWRDRD